MGKVFWNAGWLVLIVSWLGPLPDWSADSFAAHMTLHMAVVAVASPLLSLGIAGRRWDPVRYAPSIFSPIGASLAELGIVWLWHSPRMHQFAATQSLGFAIEQATFLVAGVWVWLSALGGPQPRARSRSAAGVVGLLLTSMHMTLLGALLALPHRVLYSHHVHHAPSPLGWTALFDQQVGGCVMLLIGGIAFLTGGLWLMRDLVSPSELVSSSEDATEKSSLDEPCVRFTQATVASSREGR